MGVKNLIDSVETYSGTVTLLFALCAGVWAFIKFREYVRDKRFKTYHQLIDELVNETRNQDRIIKLDRQIAIIFELRNFVSYYSVTKRILSGLKEDWKDSNPRVITEINLTLEFVSKNWFCRQFHKFFNS